MPDHDPYLPTDVIACPHCGAEQDDHASGYIIPKRSPGRASYFVSSCYDCDEDFGAELTPDGKIKVTKA